ncbi:hypothetical protein [Paraburkholderia aspalathi]|uniref:hypothetical protein n=1 Tax=Paraburkholderia aspalathi TaxID=1324617 RepID=UPI0038B7A1CD
MTDTKKKTRAKRQLLKPLVPRKTKDATELATTKALQRLESQALAKIFLPEVADLFKAVTQSAREKGHTDIETARISIALAKTLLDADRISYQQYVFMAAHPVERILDQKFMNGMYDELLAPINAELDELTRKHGLRDDQYFIRDTAPPEYIELNNRYEEVLNRKFAELLAEIGAEDLADLFTSNLEEFDRARERGRRAVFHKDDLAPAINDIISRYENEAHSAAGAKAYTAAITMVGAALEGILLLRCLLSKKKASEVAASLPRARRPKAMERPERWTFDNLIEVCAAAGWLPAISTRLADYSPSSLAHELRKLRNFVHPGRLAEERPWVEYDEREFQIAVAIFETLRQTLGGTRDRRALASVASRCLHTDDELSSLGLQRQSE